MQISKILSCRSFQDWPSYDLVFEWEDDLANELSVPIENINSVVKVLWYRRVLYNRYSRKLFGLFSSNSFDDFCAKIFPQNDFNLCFELSASSGPSVSTSRTSIPVIIDFWKHTDLNNFYEVYKNCKLVLVSSLEVVNFLKIKGCPLPLLHFPLSISDRYKLDPALLHAKQYDILLAGRTNEVLLTYLQEYSVKYPEIEFLRQENIDGELHYVSNKKGVIGKFHTRKEYMDLLRASRIGFYSTPGIDGGEERTGGFNPVTPRFLELLSAQCLVLGRYPDNEETAFYELDKVCPNITTYADFECVINDYLNHAVVPIDEYQNILQKHYTSCRAKQLIEIIKQQ